MTTNSQSLETGPCRELAFPEREEQRDCALSDADLDHVSGGQSRGSTITHTTGG